ncbi:E3 ubiquitin-protein ligase TRIM56-like [Patiria miniata]|uniref:Uncharacterized protein n=1 Tax=Patiria miniata TaxID=46514 RepID=A0A914BGZ7_PATMI|nr:E3 ubiquitin-protein ligase TRIM56-like [Patiria miniata]
MASNVTVQSVLGKISQDHLECSICSYRYEQPKLLDCLHSFCLMCLHELRQRQEPESTKLPCPLCRQDTTLKGDVAALPDNFTLGALVEEFTVQEQLLEGQGSEITCQNCDEGIKAVSRCMNCNCFLCLECDKAHRRMASMITHEVTTMAQLRSGKISYKSKLREVVPKCRKHPDQNLSIYCNTCEQLACTTCSLLDHAKHSLKGQTKALRKCKQEIAEATAKAEQKRTELSTATKEIEKIRKALDSTFADITKKIKQKVEEGTTRMSEEGQKLKQEAEKIYKDRVKTLDTAQATYSKEASDTEQKLEEMKQLTDQASCHEMLDLKQKILHNLGQLTVKQPQRVPCDLSFMDFQGSEITREIGKLSFVDDRTKLTSPARYWQIKTQKYKFGKNETDFKSATQVAAFSDNEVVIVDAECKHLISISLKTTTSPAVCKELEIDDLHNPSCVAVNKHDQLIVLAGPVITIFNWNYKFLRQFKPGVCTKPYSKPTCLAVDNKDLIAVGYQNKEEISLHRPDGTLVRILSAPGIGHYLTISKERLIYTNCKKLKSVDYNGTVVFSYKIRADNNIPSDAEGLCCDRDGNIYVAFSLYNATDEIHLFSPNGKHSGRVIKGCNYANGMAIIPNGDLVIAAESSVWFYRNRDEFE